MIRGFCVIASALLCCAVPNITSAGSFKVNPLALQFDEKTKSVVVKLTNTGEQPVTVQMDGMRWTQDSSGDDQLVQTSDIIFFPKIVTVEKGEERVIRVGYNGETRLSTERTYRFFAQELPSRNSPQGVLNFTLRFSIPIFVKPPKSLEKTKIVNAFFEQGQAKISVRNDGNEHVLITRITASGLDRSNRPVFQNDVGGWYVLPGATKIFGVAVDESKCLNADSFQISAKTNNQLLTTNGKIKSSECRSVVRKEGDQFVNQ